MAKVNTPSDFERMRGLISGERYGPREAVPEGGILGRARVMAAKASPGGNYLVRNGKKVLLLEHGKAVGGNISGIRRKGYFFDAGSQSTENVGILFTILEELGLYDPDSGTGRTGAG